ncbi:GGDEF domain-containing protein [Tsukamurella ocularis]|uniref:GGDEF domain-containing protein n=1 Tax=Tsukamurella ocularis TaxID=1970234 RepID=UPI002167D32A|nr:diguanylate cyclase [Tsukamurella ocularis]MCS3781906.1 diguanylate cyclase (GGDEF)-like protein [Tsukamurella ocularis]MCS3788400.1 diguanylate cyclase (GGDEF)-like protein [Tsukamurella ocularis]MCS3852120.1 diguanylate cyclase (GGDEF)-like protein [Tsukamurella ocularis]
MKTTPSRRERIAAGNLVSWFAYVGGTWWHGGPDYDDRIDYFAGRSLLRGFRVVVGVCAALLGSISAALLFTDETRSFAVAPALPTVIQVAGAAMGLFWAVRWQLGAVPSERAAVAFVLSSTVSIAAVCWTDAETMAGIAGLSAIVLVAVFTAFMLSPWHFVAHSALSIATIALFVPPIVAEYGVTMAAVKAVMLAVVAIGVPACVQIGIAFLSQDAADSDTDPLTSALNRRGFRRASRRIVAAHAPDRGDVPVAVMLIDVDEFKVVNDELGHHTGDAVLVRVADVLRAVSDKAVVARIGGDEFAVAVVGGSPQDHRASAEIYRRAIEAIPVAGGTVVTASIGVATAMVPFHVHDAVDVLLAAADEAMYAAKRAADADVVVSEVGVISDSVTVGGTCRGATSLAGGED